jgi:hypothetical protein
MEKNILIDEQLLKFLLTQASQKTVGKCMKRFELSDNKEEIKKQIKELLYESYRDLCDAIINCSKSNKAIHLEKKDDK